ncbi:hypothetical protein [Endozoicomonas ascidiicola]|uniref:hypothetical protein n=1 Tax=Endozoicomonas ascidiicola TaxID=1698521 RepID=UPI0008343771|nr:hypothetical protein [Endozoicomonas ascidiicola]
MANTPKKRTSAKSRTDAAANAITDTMNEALAASDSVDGVELPSRMSKEAQDRSRSEREQKASQDRVMEEADKASAEAKAPKSEWTPEIIDEAGKIVRRAVKETCGKAHKGDVKMIFVRATRHSLFDTKPLSAFAHVCETEKELEFEGHVEMIPAYRANDVVFSTEVLMSACCRLVMRREAREEKKRELAIRTPAQPQDFPGDVEDQEAKSQEYAGTESIDPDLMDTSGGLTGFDDPESAHEDDEPKTAEVGETGNDNVPASSFIDVASKALELISIILYSDVWESHASEQDWIDKGSMPWSFEELTEDDEDFDGYEGKRYAYDYDKFKLFAERWRAKQELEERKQRGAFNEHLTPAQAARNKAMAEKAKKESNGQTLSDLL